MAIGGLSGERRTPTALADINVTPFVDVVLVLLIIFIITTPMMIRGIDVKVPRTETKTVEAEERLLLTVTKDGRIFLGEQVVKLPALERYLAGVQRRNPQAAVFLRADAEAQYGAVVEVMDAVKKAGIDRLGMVTEPLEPRRGGR